MSFENLTPAPGFYEWMPIEYKDLVDYGPYKDPENRPKVTDMGKFKEIMEEPKRGPNKTRPYLGVVNASEDDSGAV